MDYERAEGLLLVLFSSPVTFEEVLVSGWPLFLSLDLFRADEGFLQMARQRLPLQTPGEHTLKWSEVVVKSIQNGQGSRIAMEPVIRLGNLAVEEVLWKAFVSIHILYVRIFIFYNNYYMCIYIYTVYCIFSLMMFDDDCKSGNPRIFAALSQPQEQYHQVGRCGPCSTGANSNSASCLAQHCESCVLLFYPTQG